MTFWVHGRGKDDPEPLGWVKGVWNGIEENLRWAGGMIGVSEPYEPGQSTPASTTSSTLAEGAKKEKEVVVESSGGGGGWFSGLRGAMSTRSDGGARSSRGVAPPGTYVIGEAKAEYVKVGRYATCPTIIISQSGM